MRAIAIGCLLLVLSASPRVSQAQLTNFFAPTQPTRRAIRVESRAGSTVQSVRHAQFDEALPSAVVPSPNNEVGTGIPGTVIEYGTDYAGPAAETMGPPPHETAQPSSVAARGESVTGDFVFDSAMGNHSFGQPYDVPIGDVVPREGVETYSTGTWFRGGNWYTRQHFIMLLRADLPHQHIAVDFTTTATGAGVTDPNFLPSLSTKDTDFTFEAGTRLTLGHRLGRDPANRDHLLEFTFFGLFDYTGRATLSPVNPDTGAGIVSLIGSVESEFNPVFRTGSPSFTAINPVDGLVNNVNVEVLHQADFNSYELNYVIGGRPAKDRLVLKPDGRWVRHATPSKVGGMFAGVRYISQNELFQYVGIGDNAIPEPDLDVGATYVVTTDNDLFGIQLGGEFVRKRTEWTFGLLGKLGGLINFAERTNNLRQTLASTDTGERVVSTTTNELISDDETLTFLAEASAYLAYYVRPNTALRVGYDVIYLNGMATATNNLNIEGDGFAGFEMTGDSLYHGMNVGFEWTW